MSESIAVVTSDNVSRDDLAAFIQSRGGFITPERLLFGRFSNHDRHVWIGVDESLLEGYREDEEMQNTLDAIRRKLGGEPQTSVIINISRTSGSEQLAADFVQSFAERWTCVVDDLHGNIFSVEEFARQQKSLTPAAA
ncbi:MAG: helix-turn-helix domain-containing protein [Acidobacteriota bacterium]|nr:helix-turn-helix domain-containing protein [Acidobacteriota bacterium]